MGLNKTNFTVFIFSIVTDKRESSIPKSRLLMVNDLCLICVTLANSVGRARDTGILLSITYLLCPRLFEE